MNTNSNSFALFGHDEFLGTLPAAIGTTGVDPALVRPQSKTSGVLAAFANPLRASEADDCVSLANALRARYPSSPVVVLLLSEKSDEALRAIGLCEVETIPGARLHHVMGSVARPVSPNPSAEVTPIMREAARPVGENVLRPPTARSLGLTQRQMDVLSLMVQGKPNKLICRELRLAEGTVKCHVSAVLRALEVGSRTQAALKAARLGLDAERSAAG